MTSRSESPLQGQNECKSFYVPYDSIFLSDSDRQNTVFDITQTEDVCGFPSVGLYEQQHDSSASTGKQTHTLPNIEHPQKSVSQMSR